MCLSYASLIVPDVARSAAFYGDVLAGTAGYTGSPSTFRSVRLPAGGALGLTWPGVIELLGLEPTTRSMLTYEVGSPAAVDEATRRSVTRGATLVSAPAPTTYGTYQSVLVDPDGHVFRLDHRFSTPDRP